MSAFRNLHFEQELKFPPRLIKQVRDAVVVLGDCDRSIGKRVGRANGKIMLIKVEEGPDGNSAVYNVLPLVTCVIPSSCKVQGIRAAAPEIAALISPFDARDCF